VVGRIHSDWGNGILYYQLLELDGF